MDEAARQTFDVAVVGSGINGAAIAHECARRRLSVVVIEKGDVAAGTSSRSSRLIHGGIRYLEYGRLGLVFESSRERRELSRMAPHLVRPLPFIWPVYAGARIPLWKLRIGLLAYDLLALFRNFRRHEVLNAAQIRGLEPSLASAELAGGVRYYDAETDDARLTLANARAALSEGANIVTYCAVSAMERAGSEILLDVTDVLSGNDSRLRARLVVNAAGPWCDSVIRMLDPSHEPVIHGSAGAHIAVPRGRIGNHHALTLISPTDGRILFVLPNGSTSVIGTTDKTSTGPPDEVRATVEDIDYLLAAANRYFPAARLQRSDVLSAWAGIRPLAARYFGGDTSSASREHELRWTDGVMLSVLGGKLTTYRVVARDAVAQLRRKLGRETSEAIHPEQLPGAGFASLDAEREAAVQAVGDGDIGRHLFDAHGSEWRDVWRLALADTTLGRRLHHAHPYLRAEVAFAVRAELALQPADVLLRRTHLAFETRDHGASVLQDVAGIMAAELGWSSGERSQALASFHGEVQRTFGYAPS